MSWFGSGRLSQITGQISNFTKEVLEEGTEEVDDPATQLRLARRRLQELEQFCTIQKTENDRLTATNADLSEKCQSSELQINTIYNEYRGILDQKETEIKDLKQRHNEIQESSGRPLDSASYIHPSMSAGVGGGMTHSASSPSLMAGYHGDEEDFDDVIRSQHEINRLRGEVQRLESECRHWKKSATAAKTPSQGSAEDHQDARQQLPALQARLQELTQKLDVLTDEHQRELSALQDVHIQKLSALKRRHKDELAHCHEQIQRLQERSSGPESGGRSPDEISEGRDLEQLRDRLSHQEQVNRKLSVDMEHTHAADREKARRLDDVTAQLHDLQAQHTQLVSARTAWEEEKQDLLDQLDALLEERRAARQQLNQLNQRLSQAQDNPDTSLGGQQGARPQVTASTPRRAGTAPPPANLLETSAIEEEQEQDVTSDLALANERLAQQVASYQREMDHVELERADWTMEKEALEDVLFKLREQVRDREDQLSLLQEQTHQQTSQDHSQEVRPADVNDPQLAALQRDVRDKEQQLSSLTQRLQSKEAELQSKEAEAASLSQRVEEEAAAARQHEATVCTLQEAIRAKEEMLLDVSAGSDRAAELAEEVEQLRRLLAEREAALAAKEAALAETEATLADVSLERDAERDKVAAAARRRTALEEENGALETERDALESGLEELDSQHQETMSHLIKARDELLAENDRLEREVAGLREKVAAAQEKEEAQGVRESEAAQEGKEARGVRESEAAQEGKEARGVREAEAGGPGVEHPAAVQRLRDQVAALTEQTQSAALALNDLHMDKEELSSTLKTKERELKELGEKYHVLAMDKRQAEQQCQRLEGSLQAKDAMIHMYKEQQATNDNVHEDVAEIQQKLEASLTETDQLQAQIRDLQAVNAQLQTSHEELEKKIADDLTVKEERTKREETLLGQVDEFSTQFEALKNEKALLLKRITDLENQFQTKTEQFDDYVKKSEDLQELDQNSLRAEHERLIQQGYTREARISELEKQLECLGGDLARSEAALKGARDSQAAAASVLASEREAEVSLLRDEVSALGERCRGAEAERAAGDAEVSRLQEVERQHEALCEEHRTCRAELCRLQGHVKGLEESRRDAAAELDLVGDLSTQLTSLKLAVAQKDERLALEEARLREAEARGSEYAARLSEVKQQMEAHRTRLENASESEQKWEKTAKNLEERLAVVLQEKTDLLHRAESASSCAKPAGEGVNGGAAGPEAPSPAGLPNGHLQEDVAEDYGERRKAELDKMEKVLRQKDTVISQLNDTNTSLLTLLEQRSQTLYGDKSLVELHGLETEVRRLGMEKEQIMSVLNEKTRECSSLKGELHRLMNVVHQEKAALNKLQQDNQHLLQQQQQHQQQHGRRDPRAEEAAPGGEMTKEAVRKLSQIIRDKDVEIGALQQKNETLLQVLQESSAEGASERVRGLMQERDQLTKQVAAFQHDREQILAALNAKHQESVAYHGEIQRLNAVLSSQTERQDRQQQEYANLAQQYEDKQQLLLKAQNDLLNYKQKYLELDNRYKDMVRSSKSDVGKVRFTHTRSGSLSAIPANSSSASSPSSPFSASASVVSSSVANASSSSSSSSSQTPSSLAASSTTNRSPEDSPDGDTAQELADLRAIIQSHEEAFAQHEAVVRDKDQSLAQRDQTLAQRDRALQDKDAALAELRARLHHVEETLRARESELGGLRKQCENAAFQLRGLESEFGDVRQERDTLHERSAVLQQEMGAVKEANNRLSMVVQDREFELRAAREKVATMSGMVQERGQDERGELERLMREAEAGQRQAQTFKQERDQALLALQQQQNENQQLQAEIRRHQDKVEKLQKELHRLRCHLVQIEENYTQEALASEEREKELRTRLALAEEKALSSSSAVRSANEQAGQQVDSLQSQLYVLAEQRDNAVLQLASVQETANQYATSLSNLQMVLEQFQHEKETQQASEIERYQLELVQYKSENMRLTDTLRNKQAELDETTEALEAAQRLSEQLDRKEELISALREEVQLRESQLKTLEEDMHNLTSSTETKVDKDLAKNLIMGYLHTPPAKRSEALQLIGRVLEFTPHEMEQMTSDSSRGWLGSLWKRVTPTTPPTTPVKKTPSDRSFSELFVNFLEKESSPQPQMRLPAERMAREQQFRHSLQHHPPPAFPGFGAGGAQGGAQGQGGAPGGPAFAPHEGANISSSAATAAAFNPFSAPMHATIPLHLAGGGGGVGGGPTSQDSHLLMKAMPPGLPMLTPMGAGLVPVGRPAGEGGSGRGSAESSGRSTPAGSGAILRDMLQQTS